MKITSIHPIPNENYPYFQAAASRDALGQSAALVPAQIPIFKAKTDSLPEALDALLLTSDLQGLAIENGRQRLLGTAIAEWLQIFLKIEMPHLRPERTGIVLAGDYFALPDRRGGKGDVREVWRSFQKHFRWVVGVGGNHDDFGNDLAALPQFRHETSIFYLENEKIELDGLKIGGVSGVVGDAGKHLRLPETEFAQRVEQQLRHRPDLLLLHQNPFHEDTPNKGGQFLKTLLLRRPEQLTVCGHAIWREPLVEYPNGAQVLNVGERVVILERAA